MLMNEPPMIEHLETSDHLFDDAMGATDVGKFMVIMSVVGNISEHSSLMIIFSF